MPTPRKTIDELTEKAIPELTDRLVIHDGTTKRTTVSAVLDLPNLALQDHLDDTTDAHNASAISIDAIDGFVADDVQEAVEALVGAVVSGVADGDKGDIVVSGGGVVWRLDFASEVGYNLRQGNGPYHVDIGDRLVWINDDGSVFFGQNHLANYDANDLGRMCPDFLWDARALRLAVRNMTMTMISDPCDINMRRFGPQSLGFPYVASGTGDGEFGDLTGLGAGSNVAQVRATPGEVPWGVGNDETTPGGQAQETNVVLTFSCASGDMPRRATDDGQASVAGQFEINIAPKNSHDFRQSYFMIREDGRTYLGNKAIAEGNSTALVNIRPHEGENNRQSLTITGTPTGGNFKIKAYEPPQSGTTFSLSVTTAVIAHNASLATIQTAIVDALKTLAGNVPGTATAWSAITNAEVTLTGGPLPGTAVTIEFTGLLATTAMFRWKTVDIALTGGTAPTATIARLNQAGIATQKALHILRISGCTGGTGDYVRIVSGAGPLVANIDSTGKAFFGGEVEIDGALNHDGNTAGFMGAAPVVRQTLGAAASDPATTQTLANNIRTALINLGLGQA